MRTLTTRIEKATEFGGTVTFMAGDAGVTLPWSQLHDEARATAAALQARGVSRGDHVAILGPTTRELVTLIQGTWLAGATIMVLPLPMRLASIEAFVAQTRVRIHKGDAVLVAIDDQLAEFVAPEPGDPPMVGIADLVAEGARLGADRLTPVDVAPEDLAILQFTSGSTAEPKGVMLPHQTVVANLDGAAEAGEMQDDDVFCSWLPLYHDMGLVGMLTLPMITGRSLVLGAPQDFLAKPLRWMQWISDNRGTVTAGPNFSWVLAAKSLRRAQDLDLSSLRIALNGAEPVDKTTVEAFVGAGAPFGLRPGCIFPAFGMAELAIAGTFPKPMRGLVTDPVDRRVLETERFAAAGTEGAEGTRSFALLGTPIPGLDMRIVEPESGRPCAEREVGELELRGTSVMSGYYKNPEATAAVLRDGWLRTGDLAYRLGDELVLCGRIKDVIILGGRNIFPDDIEKAVGTVDGVRPGNVIAFGTEGRGKEVVAVVAEVKTDDLEALRKAVHHAALEVCGVPPHEVILVAPGTLPKTSSGKLQRTLCKTQYLAGELIPAEVVPAT